MLQVPAWALLMYVAGTAFWSMVPLLLGLRCDVVMSGSMEPGLHPGDVVVASAVDASTVRPGQVVIFHDPARPGRTLVHRVVARTASGELITKGDANSAADGTPVPESAVAGLARVRIPWAGLPRYWLATDQHTRLLVAGVALVALVAVATANTEPRRRAIDRSGHHGRA